MFKQLGPPRTGGQPQSPAGQLPGSQTDRHCLSTQLYPTACTLIGKLPAFLLHYQLELLLLPLLWS